MSPSRRVVLDTTVLIDALRNRNRRRVFLAELAASGEELITSTICIAEVYSGLRPGEEQATQSFLSAFEWIPISGAIAERAGKMKSELRRQGQTRSIADMIVAATALECGSPVATDNRKHFETLGLMLLPLP